MYKCKICGKASATGKDHTGCTEKRRLELADAGRPKDVGVSEGDLAPEIEALIGHIASTSRNA